MNILTSSALTAVATAARLISGFVILKLVAIFSGPGGVAQFGQFMSLTSLLVVFAGGGIASGIIKYVAEYRNDENQLIRILNAGVSYTLAASILMGILVVIFSNQLTTLLMGGNDQFRSLIIILAVAQLFVAMHNFIVAIVNGVMDVRRLAIIHVCGAILGLLITGLLGYYFRLYGALLAFILGQGFLLSISFYFFKRSSYFNWSYLRLNFDIRSIKNLSKYSLMTLTSALFSPLVQIIVRDHLAERFSWEQAGYWQSVTKVSDAYLLFITMAISVYYLPKLSSISNRQEFYNEIKNAYKVLIPLVIAAALFVYYFRNFITLALFSPEFSKAIYLYAPQLLGDVIKIASFILSYIMLAKAMTRLFLFSEVIFGCMYVGWVWVLTAQFGVIGAMYAFVVNYIIYFLFMVLITKRYVRRM